MDEQMKDTTQQRRRRRRNVEEDGFENEMPVAQQEAQKQIPVMDEETLAQEELFADDIDDFDDEFEDEFEDEDTSASE